MLLPGSILPLRAPVAGHDQQSLIVVLPKASNAPTVIDFKDRVGAWVAWCPGATSADAISVLCMLSGKAAPAAADLNLPTPAASYKAVSFDIFRGDELILLDAAVERVAPQPVQSKYSDPKPQWTQFAFQWNGAADSYLVLRRVTLSHGTAS